MTLAFVLLFSIFSLLALRAVNDSARATVNARLVVAEMAAHQIDRTLERAVADVRAGTSTSAPVGAWTPSNERQIVQAVRARLGEFGLRVSLLDGRRRLLLAEPPTAQSQRFTTWAFVRAAAARGVPAYSRPYRDGSGKPVFSVAVRVGDTPETPRGVVVVVLDAGADDLVDPLDEARDLGATGHALLVGPDTLTIASTEPEEVLRPGEHPDFYRRMLAVSKAAVETVPYVPWDEPPGVRSHEQHVMAWAPLHTAPWGVSVGGTRAETFAVADHLRRKLLIGGCGALLVLLLMTLGASRLLVSPVHKLTLAAHTMAAGDLEQPVLVGEGGEIGILAASLETMRVRLRSSLETIQHWGESLEITVAERTSELHVRNRQLTAVAAVATAATQARELESMVDVCLAAILAHTELLDVAVRLADPRTEDLGSPLRRGSAIGASCAAAAVARGACACARAAVSRTPTRVGPDDELPGCLAGDAHGTVEVLPLTTGRRLLGVLILVRDSDVAADPRERAMLVSIADQLAVAIEDVRLLEELAWIDAQHERQRLRSELISMVSHELRTPLGFIKSYATTLIHDDASVDPATRRQFLEIIDEETAKLERMIDDLLNASQLQAERLPLELERLDVGELVRSFAARARPSLAGAPALVVGAPSEEVPVLADAFRLEQVIGNLIDNAARHGSSELPVEVSVTYEDAQALISVRDHGPGVATSEQARIFEPFQRGPGTRSRGTAGVGLGLAICRGIVEAHGGSIWVQSTEGRGSTFVVSLPLAHGDHPEPRA